MKMTQLLWRIVSVWLCVAVVCWRPSCYVGCTESRQEAQRPASSQESSPEEEAGEQPHHRKIEEHLVKPAQSPESEQLKEEDHRKEEKNTPEVDAAQHVETSETQEPASKGELEADREISQSEHRSEYQRPETSSTQDQDPVPLLPPSDIASGFSAENKEDSNTLHLQDDAPSSVSEDSSDVALPEVTDSDLPPVDCEEEDNPYDSESPPLVLENTSNAHITGTKSHTDPPLGSSAGHSSQHAETNTSHKMKEQDLSSPVTTDTDSSVSSKDPEDIPTFDEWKRKMMEVENEKTLSTHTSNNGGSHTAKKVQKNFNNYASVECGAKILGANPEAKSTSAILKENMDLYMLNPCSNKIWFIIELCEPIQLKQLDIANFELFSSTPKDFLVSISDRYPTNKWLKLGTFHGRDERTVQSFPLDEHLYAKYVKMFTKYIKVELVSHFGSEHFCPLSLIRVFGTSMVEEYEEIAEPSERTDDPDDDLDYPSGFAPGEAKLSNNLIGSAKDAILNMVNNIAVNVLGGSQEMQGNLSSLEVNMTEPPPQQPDTTAEATTTDPSSVPDTGDVKLTPDDGTLEVLPPPSEVPLTETPTMEDGSTEQFPPAEGQIVTPLEKEEEEFTSPTITLLDKEEELGEGEEKVVDHDQQQELLNYCAVGPSLSSSCSCAASVYEYLLKQCSASLSKKRKCQAKEGKQTTETNQTPSWHRPAPPAVCLEPQTHHSEVHEPHEKEQAPEQEPESVAVTSEAPQHPGNMSEPVFEPPLLEPSQALNLPKPSAADSSSAKATPIVETPQLSSERPAPVPAESQDVLLDQPQIEPSASIGTSFPGKPTTSATVDDAPAAPAEEKPTIDASHVETSSAPSPTQDKTDHLPALLPTISPQLEQQQPEPPVSPESGTSLTEVSPDTLADVEPSGSQAAITETKTEDLAEDMSASLGGSSQLPQPSTTLPPSPTSPSLSDIYADPPNGTEQNGNLVHGSSQKESVFMRLNNRIKALEMNMSLSGRYLEQLSQRYRKQMEEMQKAFNKTIIKLQNTSRIAEEQDQRQTESIQLLQGQLENVTQLVLNLSVRVSQLQSEVADRQNYLLLSLVVCLTVGLLLCANYCRVSAVSPTTEPEPPIPKSYTYCRPERQLSSCDETGLKRSASYPLIHSESFQLAATENPELLHAEETQSLGPGNRKRRRRKIKPLEKVETLKPSFHPAPELCNGAAVCNGAPVITNPTPLTKRLLHPTFRDSPSEGSSEGSSHSDDPSFCGITTACPRICDGLPPPKTRAEKRALRRRRPKPNCAVVDFLHAPRREKAELLPISTIEDIMKRKTEPSSGTFVAFSGPV